MRGWRNPQTLAAFVPSEALSYGGYDVLPEVRMIPEGELFAGTWIIACCSLGRSLGEGYRVRTLAGDNDHFASRQAALKAALLRAMRTIDLGEVGSLHLSPIPSPDLSARRR